MYDPEDIFSATNKVCKGNEWRTDARAIRDALSHNKYVFEHNDISWKVIFDNTEYGYNFKKTFTNSEFYQYMNNTDAIYRGSIMLLNAFISMILIKQHCIKKSNIKKGKNVELFVIFVIQLRIFQAMLSHVLWLVLYPLHLH